MTSNSRFLRRKPLNDSAGIFGLAGTRAAGVGASESADPPGEVRDVIEEIFSERQTPPDLMDLDAALAASYVPTAEALSDLLDVAAPADAVVAPADVDETLSTTTTPPAPSPSDSEPVMGDDQVMRLVSLVEQVRLHHNAFKVGTGGRDGTQRARQQRAACLQEIDGLLGEVGESELGARLQTLTFVERIAHLEAFTSSLQGR